MEDRYKEQFESLRSFIRLVTIDVVKSMKSYSHLIDLDFDRELNKHIEILKSENKQLKKDLKKRSSLPEGGL